MANGDYLPTVYQPQPNVTIYTPRRQRASGGTYRAYDSTPKTPKPRKPRVKKQKSMLPAVYDPNLESLAQNSEKAQRRRDLAVGKELQKRWKKEQSTAERLKMKQLRAEQRAQEKHARGIQKARSRWMKKNKRIARRIWRKLI